MRLANVFAVVLCFVGCSGDRGCAQPAAPEVQSELRVIQEAADAVGGRSAVESVRTLTAEGTGEYFHFGQNRSPEAESVKFDIKSFQRATELTTGRWRLEQLLEARYFSRFAGPFTDVMALDGDVAFDVNDGKATRQDESETFDRRAQLRHSPIGILQAALAPGAVSNLRHTGTNPVVDVRAPDGNVYTLTLDAVTRLPIKVSSKTQQTTLGDMIMETEFGGYQSVGAVKLPTSITSKLDGMPLTVFRVTKNTVNGPIPDLSAPAEAKTEAQPRIQNVTAEPLAKGVWLLGGGSHHSALVEFSDHAVLIEAPLHDTRTLAVLAKAAELLPAKPVTHVVNTHHHFDHVAGVRTAVSKGLTIVAHEKSRRFLEAVVSRPHTMAPDALAKRPLPLKMQGVERRSVHQDATRTMEIHATDSRHAETMLIVYLPKERLLIEVDDYSPSRPNGPPRREVFAGPLLEAIKSRNLDVDRVVPLHGHAVPFAEFAEAASSTKAE